MHVAPRDQGSRARASRGDLWQLKLEDYLHWLEAERRQSGRPRASMAKYLSHLRGLLEYAWRSGRGERNVLDGFSLQHTLRRTRSEVPQPGGGRATGAGHTAPGPTARRDRLMMLLLYGCGLRTSELCALDVADVNRERQELIVRKAKGDRPRAIPIPEAFTPSCSPICSSMASAARCFGLPSRTAHSRPTMYARL